jgi:tetratricopeptide (TPR) repeat protein
LWLQGDCAQAVSTWRSALSGELSSPAGFDLSRALYSQGDTAGSVAALQPGGALNYLAAIAEREPMLGQPAAARDVYDWILNVNPLPESAGLPAKAYTPATQLALAIHTWQLVADAAPASGALHWQAIAEAARLQQQWTNSRNAFDQALAVAGAGERYDLLLRQGRLLGEMRDWPGALAAYRQAVQLQPAASTEPYVAAGLVEVAQGQYHPALAWFDRGLAVLPSDPWPSVYAGNAALAFNDPVEAERRYRRALAQSRGHFGALYYYGVFLLGRGRPAEAIAVLQPIQSSGDCNVLAALRESHRALGQPAQAGHIAEQIAQQCPT